ncbi:MAG: DUF4365 domain-containing protein [Mucilaginibacter sp.]
MNNKKEERIGIYSVARIFEGMNWLFKEQTVNDFGIDAFVELTDPWEPDQPPTGQLIGLQIKSGASYFKEATPDHFVYRGSEKHLDYWLHHAIGVVLVLYDRHTGTAYWQEVNRSTAIPTPAGFKVLIPKSRRLGECSRDQLASIAYFSKDQYKLWQLRNSKEKIILLQNGPLYLYVEIDDIPRTGDYHVTLVVSDDAAERFPESIYSHNDNPNRFEYYLILHYDQSLSEAFQDTLPWAEVTNGGIFSDEDLANRLAANIIRYMPDQVDDDVAGLTSKYSALELACWLSGNCCFRFELKANQLTSAFLQLSDYLDREPIVKPRLFV